MTKPIGCCAGCDRRWNNTGQAHCAQCHRHFGSDTAFDLHLGRIPESGPPPCRDPAKLLKRDGMPRLVRRDGVWGKPLADPEWAAKRARADSEPSPAAVGPPVSPTPRSGV